MKLLYTVLLWLADKELTIALNTGRNPRHVDSLRADVQRWEDALLHLDIQERFKI